MYVASWPHRMLLLPPRSGPPGHIVHTRSYGCRLSTHTQPKWYLACYRKRVNTVSCFSFLGYSTQNMKQTCVGINLKTKPLPRCNQWSHALEGACCDREATSPEEGELLTHRPQGAAGAGSQVVNAMSQSEEKLACLGPTHR